jgi:hypothetical protein
MYDAETVQARLRERPFQPFRIVVSEGLRYEIRHPDLVFVGRRDIMIGHPDRITPTVYDQVTRVAYVHIVAIEDISQTEAPASS